MRADDPSVVAIAALAYEATDHVALSGAELEPVLGQSITELKPATHSLYGLPLRTDAGRPAGSMTLLLPDDRPLAAAEESLLLAHAEHASRALDRARRHEREHDVAVALQRSLLPDALPAIEGSTSRAATTRAVSGSRSAATGTTPCGGRTGCST